MALRVLTIFAHPDDAEALAGGTLLSWRTQGAQIVLAIVTDGDKGTHNENEPTSSVVAKRREEQAAAAALLNAEVRWLGYEDGLVQPTLALRKDVVRLIREVRPHLVLTHDPTVWFRHGAYINHPDHRAVGQAVVEALYPAVKKANVFPDLAAAGYAPWVPEELWLAATDEPNRWVDISHLFEAKMNLLLTHASQFPPEPTRLVFRRLAEEAGKTKGLPAAESFRVIRLGPRTVELLAGHLHSELDDAP
ncbi:MAG: PIG-L family deacetylase [Thermoanaerobaculum sp.]|nr:PIG-L family deacetylase [Thermoanaerobaculum sp.]